MTIVEGKYKKIVTRRVERNKPDKIKRTLNMKEFYHKRNRVLIVRSVGGLGDIFMHRMMFEDFKDLIGDGEVHFACPPMYHEAVKDHPFIDELLDSSTVDKSDYIISYNTTTACGRYEMRMAPMSGLNRSDIWSQHCGVNLKKHNMHITLTDAEHQLGHDIISNYVQTNEPVVVVCPVSAMRGKNLLDHQLNGLIQYLRDQGCCPIGLHNTPILPLIKNNVPSIHSLSIRQWMAVLNAADYVVSVDTAAFHCSGGMGKPLTGIFTFADGLAYGKHYEFELVQKHRKTNPCWTCGPCYNWGECPKTKQELKPCLTELSVEEIIDGVQRMFARWPVDKVKNEGEINGTIDYTNQSGNCN